MALLITSTGKNLDSWVAALKEAGPEVDILTLEQDVPHERILMALAWNHPPGIFRTLPALKCISSMGAGVDHLLSDPDIPEDVAVVRIVDPMLARDMFEFVLALILGHNRRLPLFAQQQSRGLWKKKRYRRIRDTRVGVMGTGAIGHHVCMGLSALGFSVSGWGRSASREGQQPPYRRHAGAGGLASFLRDTDILVCLLPLTPETRGILNRELLSQLPRGGVLINLGRGPHVVEQDLIALLDEGHLQAASLDVFDPEPLPEGHPFWKHPGVQLTPHIASLTDPASVAPQVIENYRRLRRGEPLLHRVDRRHGY
jgi:glyoxylate/hydroxypyruvate reductase A